MPESGFDGKKSMKRGTRNLPAKPLIADEDVLPSAFERKPLRGSRRDAIQSFGASFLLHLLLLLMAVSWFVSRQMAAREDFLLVTSLDSPGDSQKQFEDAPIEFRPLEPIPPPIRFEDHFAVSQDRPLELVGVSLPRLRTAQQKSAFPREEVAPEQKPTESAAAKQAVEKEIQKRLDREGGKNGAIRISLIWNNGNDLDLYVQTPVKDIIAFNFKRSRCGGELDVDMNARKTQSTKPVENVFWSAKQAPFGTFVVAVHEYQNHGFRDPTAFLVSVKVDGETHHFRGNTSLGKIEMGVCKFNRTADGVKFLDPPATIGGNNRTGKPILK